MKRLLGTSVKRIFIKWFAFKRLRKDINFEAQVENCRRASVTWYGRYSNGVLSSSVSLARWHIRKADPCVLFVVVKSCEYQKLCNGHSQAFKLDHSIVHQRILALKSFTKRREKNSSKLSIAMNVFIWIEIVYNGQDIIRIRNNKPTAMPRAFTAHFLMMF